MDLGYDVIVTITGIVLVFLILVLLMAIITLEGKIFDAMNSKKAAAKAASAAKPAAPVKQAAAPAAAPAAAAPAAAPAAPAAKNVPAPGSAGKIALHDVPDKTAAMLMAIVADRTGKPLNQLRFLSIREVKD